MKIFKYQHLRWTFLIIVAAVLTLTVSLLVPIGTLNSILQNIFAGLITGVVVTLIGSLKSRAL